MSRHTQKGGTSYKFFTTKVSAVQLILFCSILPFIPHGDKLLTGCWMDGHAVIKVRLGGPHLDGHPEALQHLVAAAAHHVEPHHLLILPGTDQLHHGLGLPAGHRVVQRGELRLVDAQSFLTELLLCFLLRQSNRPDLSETNRVKLMLIVLTRNSVTCSMLHD